MEEESPRIYSYSSYNEQLIDYLYDFMNTYGFGYKTSSGAMITVGGHGTDVESRRVKHFHKFPKYCIGDVMDEDEKEYYINALGVYANTFNVGDFVTIPDGRLLEKLTYREYKENKGKTFCIKGKYLTDNMRCKYLLSDGNVYDGLDLISQYSGKHDLELRKYIDSVKEHVKDKTEKENRRRKIDKVKTKINEIVDILEEE